MNEESRKNTQVTIDRFHFSVRLESVFFPFELGELQPLLEQAGYALRKELTQRIPEVPFGARLVVGGPIAENPNTRSVFRTDPDRGVLAIAGPGDINSIVDDFSNIEKLIQEKLGLSLESEASFYEFISEGSASTGGDPTKVIADLHKDNELYSRLNDVIGFPTTNFGVRVVERNRYPNEKRWFEFRIEPLITKPNATYTINVVYRDEKRQVVVQAARSLVDTLERLLSTIESQV